MNFNEMNTAQIIDAVRNGDITSDVFNSFEEYLEYSRKYQNLMKANSEIVKQNILHTEIYQQNKQLNEIVEMMKKEFTLIDKKSNSYLWNPDNIYNLVVKELLATKDGESQS